MDLPRTIQLLHDGIAAGLHIGAQMCVAHRGHIIADIAIGQSRPGVPLDSDTLMLWMSAGKPVTAVAIAQLWERGQLSLDDPVARFIPEFAQHNKDRITIRHGLTHTAGFRGPLNNFTAGSWEQIIARIGAMRPEPSWPPGKKAGYHVATSWFILGEIIQRITGQNYSDYLRTQIFDPLGMTESHIGMTDAQFQSYVNRLAKIPSIENGEINFDIPANTPDATIIPRPGANLRCPANQFIKFYQALLSAFAPFPGTPACGEPGRTGEGRGEGISSSLSKMPSPYPSPGVPGEGTILSPQTIEAITAPHRVYMPDHTFNANIDWCLGFLINTAPYSPANPYLYGPHASPKTFGHSGNQCSVAFADPENDLAVCLAFNGMPGEAAHQNRMREVLTVIYEELAHK